MIIKCFRCGKKIDTPNSSNADYVIAKDMVVKELRDILYSLEHNEVTHHKQEVLDNLRAEGKPIPDEALITDNDYTWREVPSLKAQGLGVLKVLSRSEPRPIQKTGIVCPECYKSTDFVIWGVHK